MEHQKCYVECLQEKQIELVKGIKSITKAIKIKSMRPESEVYMMIDQQEGNVGVFKPTKEASREVAAYLLDYPMGEEKEGLGRVPPTIMVEVKTLGGDGSSNECRIGSLQSYVLNIPWATGDEALFDLDQAQSLSLIDIRYGNKDRNKGNILCSYVNETRRLVPIDHGECFPEKSNHFRFAWTKWKQLATPYPSEMVDYVAKLDVATDLDTLKKNGIDLGEEAIFAHKVRTTVLKAGVTGGYSPLDIGYFMEGVYLVKRIMTLGQVVEECTSFQRNNGIGESEFLEMISERTKMAIEHNREVLRKTEATAKAKAKAKGSTSRGRGH